MLKGKKTYLTVVAVMILAVLDHFGMAEISNELYGLLTAVGLVFSRQGSVKE